MKEGLEQKAIPWELRKETGFFSALWQTIRLVLLQPGEFFSRLKTEKPGNDAALFYFIVYAVIFAVTFSINIALKRVALPAGLMAFVFFLLVPCFIALFLYAGAGVLHLFVLLLKGKGGFRGTLNVYAYNAAATGIFSVIPFIGGVISALWAAVVGVIGFKAVHKFTTAKAVLAYVVCPLLLVVAFVIAAAPFIAKGHLKVQAFNESTAVQAIKNISSSVESYKVSNGRYPADKYGIKYTQESSSLMDKILTGESVAGYRYSLVFRGDGYEITAAPDECGVSGNKVFKMDTGGPVSQEDCRR